MNNKPKQNKMEPKRNFGYIQLTRKCNRKCVFCSNPYVDDELTYEEAKKQIDDYIKKGVNEIIFTGGEPTLNKNLPDLIKYCHSISLDCRVITNAQKLANPTYVKKLAQAGLSNIAISIYSHKRGIEEKLTKTRGSYKKTLKGIKNALKLIEDVNFNITINSLNANHLDKLVRFLVENFPKVDHFVFNNLDPTGKALENKWTIPKLVDIELNLHKALYYLRQKNKTFRVERVPLCYMQGFEEFSTETRQIVKNQMYRCLFLDKNGRELREITNFYREKNSACKVCSLNRICAGLDARYAKIYGFGELYPLFKDLNRIVKNILKKC